MGDGDWKCDIIADFLYKKSAFLTILQSFVKVKYVTALKNVLLIQLNIKIRSSIKL